MPNTFGLLLSFLLNLQKSQVGQNSGKVDKRLARQWLKKVEASSVLMTGSAKRTLFVFLSTFISLFNLFEMRHFFFIYHAKTQNYINYLEYF